MQRLPFTLGHDICSIPRVYRLLTRPTLNVSINHTSFQPLNNPSFKSTSLHLVAARILRFARFLFTEPEFHGFCYRWNSNLHQLFDPELNSCHFYQLPVNDDHTAAHLHTQSSSVGRSILTLSQYLAGRWAAKEAAIKAISGNSYPVIISRQQILMTSLPGKVTMCILRKPLPKLTMLVARHHVQECLRFDQSHLSSDIHKLEEDGFARFGGQEALVSISHDTDYASAICIVRNEAFDKKMAPS